MRAWVIGLGLLGCRGEEPEVTWHADVRPVVEASCVSCHSEGGSAPFVLDDWSTAKVLSAAIVDSVESRRMPPFGFDDDCRDVIGSQRLTEAQIALFSDWAAADYPEGDEADYVEVVVDEPAPLREPDIVATPVAALMPDLDVSDDYRCLWTDHTFDAPTWVLIASAWPDQVDVVHHVITYAIPEGAWPDVEALDEADPNPGFFCPNGPMVDAIGLGGWVPGGEPTAAQVDPSADAARLIPANSRVLIEVHYNMDAAGEAAELADATQVPIWTLPEGAEPQWRLNDLTAYNFDLDIPAGASYHSASATLTMPVEGELVSTAPHMHTLGVGLETTLVRGDEEQCVTRIDPWDFNWQRTYGFAEPQPLAFNDQLRLTCHYDNSEGNQPEDGLDPVNVSYGEGTRDEMCFDFLTYRVAWEGEAEDGLCAGFKECYRACEPGDEFCVERCMSVAGEGCLDCGINAMFDSQACAGPATAAGACLFRCDGADEDWWGCLSQECGTSWAAMKDCWQPALESGQLARELAVCPGLEP